MVEIFGDLWSYHLKGHWVGITTCGVVKRNGELVMGAGIAKQARDRFPHLAEDLGGLVPIMGNVPLFLPAYHLFSFPTKYHWQSPSDLELIERSARRLMSWVAAAKEVRPLILPRPGCLNGQLTWDVVRPILEPILDDRVHVITNV